MPSFLPLFPLNLVVFPKEKLPLHIFEPRYRQLIGECIDRKINFGIPAFLGNRMPGYGTEMKVESLINRHEDGTLDIITYGVRVFRIVDFINPVPGKLYAGGEVEFIVQETDTDPVVTQHLIQQFEKLYDLMKMEPEVVVDDVEWLSFALAHKVGLSQEQEYELLTLPSETDRQQFLSEHLENALPVIEEMEKTKDRIRMNGHFRTFDRLDF